MAEPAAATPEAERAVPRMPRPTVAKAKNGRKVAGTPKPRKRRMKRRRRRSTGSTFGDRVTALSALVKLLKQLER